MKIDKDLVAFITGASSGFGWEVAKDLLEAGAKCYLTDRDDKAIEFTKTYPKDRCVFRKLDVSDEQGVKDSFDDCAKHFGYISVAVNSAGIGSPFVSILDPTLNTESINACLSVNVVGTFNVTKYAALQMVKQSLQNKDNNKDYLIINFGSSASTHAYQGMSVYAASKGAVLGMTLPIARDVGKYGVRVVCFTPGFFNTNMTKVVNENYYKALQKPTCLGRHGESSELSLAVQGVIQSSFITGTFFHMDSTFASPHL